MAPARGATRESVLPELFVEVLESAPGDVGRRLFRRCELNGGESTPPDEPDPAGEPGGVEAALDGRVLR